MKRFKEKEELDKERKRPSQVHTVQHVDKDGNTKFIKMIVTDPSGTSMIAPESR